MLQEDRRPADCLDRRRAGILLHITSLPGSGACGDLGPDAHHFIDFLVDCGMSVWQMLPIGPTGGEGSPYQCSSVHAGNPRLISLWPLLDKGWLEPDEAEQAGGSDEGKRDALRAAWNRFQARASQEDREVLQRFVAANAYWLDDFALFQALADDRGQTWWEWPDGLRDRDPTALEGARARLRAAIEGVRFEQFLFFDQWRALRDHANARGVKLFGDMPIFVAHDSAEVWARPRDFDLHADGQPRVVAGVPPDYFSATGQRWGNPLYRWDRMEADGYRFWLDRMRTQLHLFDMSRIDHFRGFEAYWEIPAEEPNAVQGRWVKAPGDAVFTRLHQRFDQLPLIAEDLGTLTPEVEALRKKYRLPGMKVLQFAFSGEPENPYLPFHHGRDSVVYTGTHDNNTTLGWYRSLDDHARAHVDESLGRSNEAMPWPLIRCALASRAHLAILPMQDVLGLDEEHRMNMPGTPYGNWQWRFSWDQVEPDLPTRLSRPVRMYGR